MQSKISSSKNFEKENNLGICLKKPFAISYATLAARIRSYSNWTRTSPRPVDLADAGFFYAGPEDVVQCFYCGLKLKSWDVFDNPWVEHARHGKNCPHVSNVKGNQFYKQINQVEEDGPVTKPVTNRCIYSDDLISTTAAQALLSMRCYKEQDIMDAIKLFVAEKARVDETMFWTNKRYVQNYLRLDSGYKVGVIPTQTTRRFLSILVNTQKTRGIQ